MTPVHPDNLAEIWPWVRSGAEQVARKGGTDGWIPEDIYLALKTGRSALYITEENGERTGFVVLTPAEGYRGKKLHIWAAYHTAGNAVGKYLPKIREIAKSIGANRVEFQSMRNWEKFYQRGMTTYYTEV